MAGKTHIFVFLWIGLAVAMTDSPAWGGEDAPAEAPQAEQAEDTEATATRVGWLELSGELPERDAPYAWASGGRGGASLRRVVQALQQAARDDGYAGVVIYLDEPLLDFAQVSEISEAVKALRDAGRKVLVFAQSYDLPSYLLACSADLVLLQHRGELELAGLSVEELYLAGLLEKIGVKADLCQVGRFKGADEPLTRTGPSEAWTQNIDSLLDDLYEQVLRRVSTGRNLSREQVEHLLAQCWTMTDQQYLEQGLIDQLVDRDLVEATGEQFGDNFEWTDLLDSGDSEQDVDNPFVMFRLLFQEPEVRIRRASLALVHMTGPIAQGEGDVDGGFGGMVGSRTMTRALGDAKDNPKIKGVVLRIDSPGGSALASELIWQAVRELSDAKPVFVSIGSMAASGGYYIASGGKVIYVSPDSLLGSIGVVGGKMTLGGLYEKVGISVYRRSRGPNSDMFNSVEPFTLEQRAALENTLRRIYDQFTDRVLSGRGKRLKDIDPVAHGRVFTGRQAVENGLADRVGGVEAALAGLAEEVGLEPGKYDVIDLPLPRSFSEVLEEFFSMPGLRVQGAPSVLGAARLALDPRAWRAVQPVLAGLALLRDEPVLAIMPAAMLIR